MNLIALKFISHGYERDHSSWACAFHTFNFITDSKKFKGFITIYDEENILI